MPGRGDQLLHDYRVVRGGFVGMATALSLVRQRPSASAVVLGRPEPRSLEPGIDGVGAQRVSSTGVADWVLSWYGPH